VADSEYPETQLIVTNGFDKLYRVLLKYAFMDSHRTKVGIEGTWQAYFDLFKEALNDGDKGVKVMQFSQRQI